MVGGHHSSKDVELEREGLAVPLLEAGLAEAALRCVDEQMEGIESVTVVADPILKALTLDRIMVEDQHVALQTVVAEGTERCLLDRHVAVTSLAADEVPEVAGGDGGRTMRG